MHYFAAVVVDLPFNAIQVVGLLLIGGLLVTIGRTGRHSGHEYSKVLYAELVKPDGNPVTGGKYAVENSSARGCLQIPEEALTGYYYLKSYKRWMRNGSQEEYSFIRLKIINPYTERILKGRYHVPIKNREVCIYFLSIAGDISGKIFLQQVQLIIDYGVSRLLSPHTGKMAC